MILKININSRHPFNQKNGTIKWYRKPKGILTIIKEIPYSILPKNENETLDILIIDTNKNPVDVLALEENYVDNKIEGETVFYIK
jgi:hypothetical protein